MLVIVEACDSTGSGRDPSEGALLVNGGFIETNQVYRGYTRIVYGLCKVVGLGVLFWGLLPEPFDAGGQSFFSARARSTWRSKVVTT